MAEKKINDRIKIPLHDRLWSDEMPQHTPDSTNPHWDDIPLANRLWPEKNWPPMELLQMPPSPGVNHEIRRLFAEYCKNGQDGWD